MVPETPNHFAGKPVAEHLKEAREKGALAAAETHGTEISGFWGACCDAAKEVSVISLLLFLLFRALPHPPPHPWPLFALFLAGIALWKVGRAGLLGWARLERMHRLIEEERWEIEHHRPQEREELRELYQAKGLSGRLLDEVVDTLMADDNRLLEVMLTEELGLRLESMEHPLLQAIGAGVGAIAAALLALAAAWWTPIWGLWASSSLTLLVAVWIAARAERVAVLPQVVWHLSWLFLSSGLLFFLF